MLVTQIRHGAVDIKNTWRHWVWHNILPWSLRSPSAAITGMLWRRKITRHCSIVGCGTLWLCGLWAILLLLPFPCYHNTHFVHWRYCGNISSQSYYLFLRSSISFPCCDTCNTPSPCRPVSGCCFPVPPLHHPVVSSPLYFALMPWCSDCVTTGKRK